MKKVLKTKKDINRYGGHQCRYCSFSDDNLFMLGWHEFTTHGFCDEIAPGWHAEPVKFW